VLLRWLKHFMLLKPSILKAHLDIFVQPHQLTLVRRNGVFKKNILHQAVITVLADANSHSWAPAIAALGVALQDNRWRDATPTIILSNHFVRYTVIPWNSLLNHPAEKQAYLKYCFAQAYGEAAKFWDLRMSNAGLNMPALASGVEAGLLSALLDVHDHEHLDLQHIYPHLMVALNALKQQKNMPATQNSFWFVLLEEGRICLALINQGALISVKTYTIESDLAQQISAMIRRESVMCGLDIIDLPVLVSHGVHGASVTSLALNQIAGHPVIRLEKDDGQAASSAASISQHAIPGQVRHS